MCLLKLAKLDALHNGWLSQGQEEMLGLVAGFRGPPVSYDSDV